MNEYIVRYNQALQQAANWNNQESHRVTSMAAQGIQEAARYKTYEDFIG